VVFTITGSLRKKALSALRTEPPLFSVRWGECVGETLSGYAETSGIDTYLCDVRSVLSFQGFTRLTHRAADDFSSGFTGIPQYKSQTRNCTLAYQGALQQIGCHLREGQMVRSDICRKNICELDLVGLAELCRNVAGNCSASPTQADTAHGFRVQWIRMSLDHATEADKRALKKRMADFLTDVPAWLRSGLASA
jgi:hypothetical protein